MITLEQLSLNFFRPEFARKLLAFDPDVIHYVLEDRLRCTRQV